MQSKYMERKIKIKNKNKLNKYSPLTKISLKYIRKQHEIPHLSDAFRICNLLSPSGRANFKYMWDNYRKWTILHIDQAIKDTLYNIKKG